MVAPALPLFLPVWVAFALYVFRGALSLPRVSAGHLPCVSALPQRSRVRTEACWPHAYDYHF